MVIIPVYCKYNENKGAYFTEFVKYRKKEDKIGDIVI